MSMDRQDWIVRGRQDADADLPPRDVKPGTWQHAAYTTGYHSQGGRIELGRGQTPQSIKSPPPIPAAFPWQVEHTITNWPRAAAEHYRKVYADYKDGHNSPKREARLLKVMLRMMKRHGVAVAA